MLFLILYIYYFLSDDQMKMRFFLKSLVALKRTGFFLNKYHQETSLLLLLLLSYLPLLLRFLLVNLTVVDPF